MGLAYFDCHCDTASLLYQNNTSALKNVGHIDFDRVFNFKPYAQFFAFFINKKKSILPLTDGFEEMYKYFMKQIELHSDKALLCSNASDLDKAFYQNKVAAFLSIEGAETINCNIENLEKAYHKGFRMTGITWNHDNELSGSAMKSNNVGLSAQGVSFVQKANDLSMLVDVSHISEAGFWGVTDTINGPFIASHSNSKKLVPHKRNLSDDQFLELISKGGICGINLYKPFLTNNDNCFIFDVIRHIEHFSSLGGIDNLSIGADFDGCDELPNEINGIQDIPKLYNELLMLNYKEEHVKGIFFYNLYNLIKTILL